MDKLHAAVYNSNIELLGFVSRARKLYLPFGWMKLRS